MFICSLTCQMFEKLRMRQIEVEERNRFISACFFKANTPLRPILSMIGSAQHELAFLSFGLCSLKIFKTLPQGFFYVR